MYGKNAWSKYDSYKLNDLMKFNKEYMKYISGAKTERECVDLAIEICKSNGFKELSSFSSLKPGDKVYTTNKGRNIAAFIIGDNPIESGINLWCVADNIRKGAATNAVQIAEKAIAMDAVKKQN